MRYRELRAAMLKQGIQQSDLGGLLRLSKGAVSNRFTQRVPWTIPEAYGVMAYLSLPLEELPRYFPPDGVTQ